MFGLPGGTHRTGERIKLSTIRVQRLHQQQQQQQQQQAQQQQQQLEAIHYDHQYGCSPFPPVSDGAQESGFEPNRVSYYGHTVLELIIFLMNWIDAVREGMERDAI